MYLTRTVVYTCIYIYISKVSIFANPLMKKPGSSFAIAKMRWKTPEAERNFKKNDLHLYIKCDSSTGVFSYDAHMHIWFLCMWNIKSLTFCWLLKLTFSYYQVCEHFAI